MIGAWEGACGPLREYGMKHAKAFAHLCNARVAVDDMRLAAAAACAPAPEPAARSVAAAA
eukprot:scaffold6326_cov327-Prasinococcus_capsulatus_cf.AAC.1